MYIHTCVFAMAQERRDQKITLIAGVSVVTQKLMICTIVFHIFRVFWNCILAFSHI